MEKESWVCVVGWEGVYEVSSLGRVRRANTLNVLRGRMDRDGYRLFCLSLRRLGRRHTNAKGHRLVAEAFLPNPSNKPQVNHLNNDRSDNRVENLEWATASENTKHAYKTGSLTQRGVRNNASKLTPEKVIQIRQMWAARKMRGRWGKPTICEIAAEFCVSSSCIKNVVYQGYWSHVK